MSNPPSILLKNGTVLQHGENESIHAVCNTDVLIVGQHIKDIGASLVPDASTVVLDCTNKIISPGFIDTHHHVWQTQLKGRHGDHTLLDYIPTGNLQSHNYTAADTFWGQLAGNLELLDSATTTVVDYCHVISSPEHAFAAAGGAIASGIRSIFCSGPMQFGVARWTVEAFEVERGSIPPDWFLPTLEKLFASNFLGPERLVQLGFYFDAYFLPGDAIAGLFKKVRDMGIKLITSHFRHFPIPIGQTRIPETLDSLGLLGPDIILAHGNGVTGEQAQLLKQNGVHLSTTPDTEIFLAAGQDPIAFREDLQPLVCLGADCHTIGPGNMFHQMQLALAHDRDSQMNSTFGQGKYPARWRATVQAAFNLATIRGAKAIGMSDKIGSLEKGKLADIVVFDTSTPTMACAAETDPLTAIVRLASVREVDTVIINGKIRKSQGRLNEINLSGMHNSEFIPAGMELPVKLSWSDIAGELLQSKIRIDAKAQYQSSAVAKAALQKILGGSDDTLL